MITSGRTLLYFKKLLTKLGNSFIILKKGVASFHCEASAVSSVR